MFDVLLFEPEIPGNTGNVIRLCANTGARLHLVGRLGFTLDEARLKRAGLDYHDLARVECHADLAACVAKLRPSRLVLVETGGESWLSELALRPGDCFVFGPETRGLPADFGAGLAAQHPAAQHRGMTRVRASLPMRPSNRSLNLANAVAVTVYEAWRQNGFAGAAHVTAGAHVTRTPP